MTNNAVCLFTEKKNKGVERQGVEKQMLPIMT